MSVEMKITEESVKSKTPPSMPPVPDEAKKTIETESDKEKESSNKHTVDVKTLKVILEMLVFYQPEDLSVLMSFLL